MKTLFIYDNSGTIYSQMAGAYILPTGGVQFLEMEIPEGKTVREINVSVTPNVPIFLDLPLNETDLLKKRIDEQEQALLELASMLGGVV